MSTQGGVATGQVVLTRPVRVARRRVGVWTALLLAPAVVYLLALFVYPLLRILTRSLFDPDFTVRHFVHFFQHEAYFPVLVTTFEISLTVTVLALLLGYPMAYLMATSRPLIRIVLALVVILPFLTSILVRSFAWMVILGRQGLLNNLLISLGLIGEPLQLMYNRLGVYVGLVHVLLPMMILPLYSVMTGIDRSLLRASANLGAGPARTFFRVFLPLSLPGIVAGSLLVFIQTLGFFITPALLGGRREVMIAQLIELQINQLLNWGFASAIAIVLLLATVLLFFLYTRLVGLDRLWGGAGQPTTGFRLGWRPRTPGEPGLGERLVEAWRDRIAGSAVFARVKQELAARARPREDAGATPPSWLVRSSHWLVLICAGVGSYLLLPIAIVLIMSFSASEYLEFPPSGFSLHLYQKYLTSPVWIGATLRSFRVGLLVMLLATFLGTLAAFPLVRKRFPAKELANAFLISPMILPVIVTSLSIYYYFASLKLVGTDLSLVLAHTLLGIPFVVLIVSATLKGFDQSLERASMSLGAGHLRTFFWVTLPIIKPGLISAAIFAFLASFDELVIAMFISGVRATTLPKQMWDSVHDNVDPTLSAVSAVLIAVTVMLLLLQAGVRRMSERMRHAQAVARVEGE